MPNLKDLKVRINSVKSTQKITSAMKMVAAAKLRRAQEQAVAARPYAERMERMLGSVAASVAAKARIVAEDERETSGARALLNLGHTFGHALEAETGFSDRLLHGEGVALGMVLAARYSARRGTIALADAEAVAAGRFAPDVDAVERQRTVVIVHRQQLLQHGG